MATMTQDEIDEAKELAYSSIILHLGDKVLREVAKEKTAAAVWLKLESLYMTKSLTNKVYLKALSGDKDLDESLDEFSKIILDLENLEIKIDDEDQAIMILNALPPSYHSFVETMKYSRDSLSLEEVISALKSKQIERNSSSSTVEGLSVHMKFDKKNFQKKASKGGFKSKVQHNSSQQGGAKKLKCFFCHKEGHFRKDCPVRKKQNHHKDGDKGEAASAEEGYKSADVLVVTKADTSQGWILDSGCSYHMTPNKAWIQEFKEVDGGLVLLGNDKACRMKGAGTVKLKLAGG
ncbi:unnamed protein product [Rhodiola kirilowii]